MIKNKFLMILILYIGLSSVTCLGAEQPEGWIDWAYKKIASLWQKTTIAPTAKQSLKTNSSSVEDFKTILAHNFPGDESTTNDTIETLKKRYPKGTPEYEALIQALEEMFINRMKAKFIPDMPTSEKMRLTLAETNKIYNHDGTLYVEGKGPFAPNVILNANIYYRNQGLDKLYKELYDQSIAEKE